MARLIPLALLLGSLTLAAEPTLVREVPGPQGSNDANSIYCWLDSVAFSPDGKTMAAGAGPHVYLWNVADGKELLKLQLPDKQVYHRLAFADDGKSLLWNGREDGVARVFDTKTGRQVREFPHPKAEQGEGHATFRCYSPDAKLIAYNGPSFFTGVDLLDVTTGKVSVRIPDVENVRGAAFSPDGKLLATIGGERGLHLWDVKTGRAFRELRANKGAGGAYLFVVWSPDGRYLATGGHGIAGLEIWSVKTRKLVCTIPCRDSFYHAAFSPDGLSILCAESDGLPYLYHLIAEKATLRFNPPDTEGLHVVWRPGNRVAIIGKATTAQARQYAVYLYDIPAEALNPRDAQVDDASPDKLWDELGSPNELRVQRVTKALLATPQQAVALVKAKVPTTGAERQGRLEQTILQLGDADPKQRDAAMQELTSVGHAFEPLLRARADQAGPGEVRNRLRFLLKQLEEQAIPAQLVAELRGVELLRTLGTPEARELLKKLAEGTTLSRVAVAAREALE